MATFLFTTHLTRVKDQANKVGIIAAACPTYLEGAYPEKVIGSL